MKDELNDTEKELIAKSLANETSMEEEKALQEWISRSPSNEQQFLAYKKAFTVTQQHLKTREHRDLDAIDVDAEWKTFTKTIHAQSDNNIRTLEPAPSASSPWWRMAAAVLILITAGLIINYMMTKTSDVQVASTNNTKQITLPDGSSVTINRNSTISYAEDFGSENRTLSLSGEAFFDVAHNPDKPFIIEVKSGRIEVIGTSFNVQAYDSVDKTEVIVKTGVVKFSVPTLKQEIKLVAGDKGVFTKANPQLVSTANDDANYLSWNTHELTFQEHDLRSVIATINKTYNVNITLQTAISDTCVVTVRFENQSLDAVLRVLENTLNLTYRRKGNQIEIIEAGC